MEQLKPRNLATFRPATFYHVFNRTNNKENLFKTDDDRLFFLDKVKKYFYPYFEIHAYCLLSNHFHFLLETKTIPNITTHLQEKNNTLLTKTEFLFQENLSESKEHFHELIRIQLLRFFTCYSKNFNKSYGRSGNLFYRPFKRIEVTDRSYLKTLLIYIHKNPVKHLIINNFRSHRWSSFHEYLLEDEDPKLITSKKMIQLFNSIEQYIDVHNQKTDFELIADLIIE